MHTSGLHVSRASAEASNPPLFALANDILIKWEIVRVRPIKAPTVLIEEHISRFAVVMPC
jgi:hypothetical protein